MNHFKGKHFQKDVIIVAVSYYLRFNLSYCNIQELLSDRGINVCYSTIQRWVKEYGTVLYQLWKRKTAHWKMDETYIKVKGQWKYLYRAVDTTGQTVDFLLTVNRDTAGLRFFRKAIRRYGEPDIVTIDKISANKVALDTLNMGKLPEEAIGVRQNKYLNILIE